MPKQSKEKPVADSRKRGLLKVLDEMPDEAFGYFVAWAAGTMMQYPDGLGGFLPESRQSIKALRAAAAVYLKHQS